MPAAVACCTLIAQVKMHLKGKTTHHEQQQQKKQEEKAAAKAAKSGKSKAATNGPALPAAATAGDAASNTAGIAEAGAKQQLLMCGSCGEETQGMEAAKAHAAATGHTNFEEVVAL